MLIISIALEHWLVDLPSSISLDIGSPINALPHILMIHLSHAWLIILLYRPFYRPFAGLLTSDLSEETETSQSAHVAWAVKVCQRIKWTLMIAMRSRCHQSYRATANLAYLSRPALLSAYCFTNLLRRRNHPSPIPRQCARRLEARVRIFVQGGRVLGSSQVDRGIVAGRGASGYASRRLEGGLWILQCEYGNWKGETGTRGLLGHLASSPNNVFSATLLIQS